MQTPIHRRNFLATTSSALAVVSYGLETSKQCLGFDASSKKKIRVAQIGTTHAHATTLQVYRQSKDYEVVGIAEPNSENRKAAESQSAFQNLPWMTEEQLLRDPDIQVLLVETPVRELLDTAERCLEAGKHIHLDKPAGESLTQYKRILDQAERKNLMVQMGYMYRYNPGVILLREFLKKGWLGDIFEVHTVIGKVVDHRSRLELSRFQGGMMFELGCHVLDLVIGVLGEPRSVRAFSQHASKVDDDLNDNMLAVLEYPRALATVKTSGLEVDGGDRRHLTVCGTKGTFHIQPMDNLPIARITLAEACGDYRQGTQQVTFPKFVRYVEDASDMAQVIRGEKVSDFSYAHDYAVQATLLKASQHSTS